MLNNLRTYAPGLIVVISLAVIATLIQHFPFMQSLHLNSMMIAIVLGIIVHHTGWIKESWFAGIRYSYKKLLRLAIILLGFQLSFKQLIEIGGRGLLTVSLVTCLSIVFIIWLGKKMKVSEETTWLLSIGTSICGASAVAAVAPLVDSKQRDLTMAIGTITIFGSISMFSYPLIFHLFSMSESVYAVWTGSSVHEVAQVVAAGFAVGQITGEEATLVKLARVLWLVPVVLWLSFKKKGSKKYTNASKVFPWFVVWFVVVICIHSTGIVAPSVENSIIQFDRFLLTVAMAGLGLETSFSQIKELGWRPILLGAISTVFISTIGLILALILI